MLYKLLVKPLLSLFPPESSTGVLLRMLKGARRIPLVAPLIRAGHSVKGKNLEREVFGVRFSGPVGVAAGLDRSGEFADLFSDFGFSFIEIGSLTPLPQDGEARPRVFTLPRDTALVSRTGNPNKGVQQAISELSRRDRSRSRIRIGVNITAGSRSVTEEAIISDYRTAFAQMYDFADYFVVNLTDTRHPDQGLQADSSLMSDVLDELLEMRLVYDGYKPVLLKVSSDLNPGLLDSVLDYALLSGIDGIVAGGPAGRSVTLNTSAQRLYEIGEGGISGAPAFQGMLETVRHIAARSKGRLPIVACGGILSPKDAQMALEAGASLVEMYSAIWYKGPKIAKKTYDHILHLHDR